MSLRGYYPKQSLLKHARDCFGQGPRNNHWASGGSLLSVEDVFFGSIPEDAIAHRYAALSGKTIAEFRSHLFFTYS
ncbi:MAG: hypothetical protein JETT_3573 [Candidatus Jettenia ecosi]|uniref:Uncharacterized protein n=1 Tax=Candidatus Jettenia ecosi TaxID=2494326 RepID=A0A533Q6E6_9BACT|nr:MAG: hypothetical protein JETT_3573 [Candidatus Jettenia ecosi]